MRLLYDREADVLYVAIGRPAYTGYEEQGENLILRRDPKTGQIVGFTIIDFAARFAQKETPLSVPLNATLSQPASREKHAWLRNRKPFIAQGVPRVNHGA